MNKSPKLIKINNQLIKARLNNEEDKEDKDEG